MAKSTRRRKLDRSKARPWVAEAATAYGRQAAGETVRAVLEP
jgi:hypothetical protein